MSETILVLTARSGDREFDERMPADDLIDPEAVGRRRREDWDRLSVSTQAGADRYGQALIDAFNATRRPGDIERVFVSARLEVVDDG